MLRTNFKFGYALPYGTFVKLRSKSRKYRSKKYIFIRNERGKAVIFYKGLTEKSTFSLIVNPKKVIILYSELN